MDAHEQQLVVSVSPRPSGQLAGCACVRAWEQHCMRHTHPIHEGFAARTAESIGKLSDCQLHATAALSMNPTGATRAVSIQYP
jgi:hypothetical protein